MHVVRPRGLSKHDDGAKMTQKSEHTNSTKLPGLLLFLSEQAIALEKGKMHLLQRNLPCYVAALCGINYVRPRNPHPRALHRSKTESFLL